LHSAATDARKKAHPKGGKFLFPGGCFFETRRADIIKMYNKKNKINV
jgi:hypothetical protein